MDNRLWTAREAAQYLGISLRTFSTLANQGAIPGARLVGRQWRVDPFVLKAAFAEDAAESSGGSPGADLREG